MIGFLTLYLHVLASPFKTQARLEAEIVLLRHQLSGHCHVVWEVAVFVAAR
jgi:hypothetical protein